MIAHVGETLGHLVRAQSVAASLCEHSHDVHIVAEDTERVRYYLEEEKGLRFSGIRWQWSHNSASLEAADPQFVARIIESALDIRSTIDRIQPDLVLGFPGVLSTLLARACDVPHASVMHAPYLVPLWTDEDQSAEAVSIRSIGQRVCLAADYVAAFLNRQIGTPLLKYEEFLESERIFVPQPGLSLGRTPPGLTMTGFIKGSLGPAYDGEISHDSCYVTFGSGNPCDISGIVDVTAQVFEQVIVSTRGARLPEVAGNVRVVESVASRSLAGHVRAVVSHGGLGTVGTFAEFGHPQLVIPTEFDQATTGLYCRATGIAATCGLEAWPSRRSLGRQLPPLSADTIRQQVTLLSKRTKQASHSASGADDIAGLVESKVRSAA